MEKTIPVAQATSDEAVLPERVQEALGQLVRAAKAGLLALSVSVGWVLGELLEEQVEQLVGPKGKWNPDRTAVRHGHEDGERWPARAGEAAARLARASAIVRRPRIPSVRESAVL